MSPAVSTAASASGSVQFTATGTYSAAPYTVSPLSVAWQGSWGAVPQYCIENEGCAGMNSNGVAMCFGTNPSVTITATAPQDPTLPVNTQNVPTVSGTAKLTCP